MLDMFPHFTNSELQDRRLNCLKCNNHAAFSVFQPSFYATLGSIWSGRPGPFPCPAIKK